MHGTLLAFLPPLFTSLDVAIPIPILFICSTKLVSLQKVILYGKATWLGTARPRLEPLILSLRVFSKTLIPAGMLMLGCCWGEGCEVTCASGIVSCQHPEELKACSFLALTSFPGHLETRLTVYIVGVQEGDPDFYSFQKVEWFPHWTYFGASVWQYISM